MRITITTKLARTPSLEAYVEKKLAPLARMVKQFDAEGVAGIRIEISRTTRHHRKGEVFVASADITLPKKILRAEEYAEDVRTAIDRVKNTLRLEIEKHKTKLVEPRREQRK
jgi:ribosomal subunit interface protein